MINGAKKKYNQKTKTRIYSKGNYNYTQCKFYFSDSLKYCSSYEDFLKHQKIVQICDNIDIIRLSTPCHKSDLN